LFRMDKEKGPKFKKGVVTILLQLKYGELQ